MPYELENEKSITIKEYLDKFGNMDIEEKDMFRFWSDKENKSIGGKFKKGKPMF